MKTLFGLPSTVKYCSRCIVSNQRPSSTVEFENNNKQKETIQFDDDGVCVACRWHDIKYNEIDWDSREEELLRLVDRFRSKTGDFDVVVPGSGGKDSLFVSNELKQRYGMTPLTVTWPPHIYTEIGWKNFQSWLDMGIANISLTPNKEFHRRLTAAAFKNLCHPFQPFILGQKRIGVATALDYGIPLVMYGESQAEGGTDIREAMSPKMPTKYFSKADSQARDVLLGGVHYDEWLSEGASPADLRFYQPNSLNDIQRQGVEVHHFGYYKLWRPQDRYYYAVENSNFQPNPVRTEGTYSKYSSLDDKLDGFHYYTTFVKFGIGRATYDAAQEIRNGHITRDEGVSLVRTYDGEFPEKYFQEFLDYCSITEDQFWSIINTNRSPHLWIKERDQWRLRYQVK